MVSANIRGHSRAQSLQEDVFRYSKWRRKRHQSLPRVAHSRGFHIRLQIDALAERGWRAILNGAMDVTPHLLIVDDDREICSLLSNFLVQYGYRVSVATNGGAMMQILASAKIDLVVLDIMLPGKDGLALCRGAAHREQGPHHHAYGDRRRSRPRPRPRNRRRRLPDETLQPARIARRIRAVLRRAAHPGSGAPPGASTWRDANFSRRPARSSCCGPPSSTFFSPSSSGHSAP
jgi:CheY-like chemotaxis protein